MCEGHYLLPWSIEWWCHLLLWCWLTPEIGMLKISFIIKEHSWEWKNLVIHAVDLRNKFHTCAQTTARPALPNCCTICSILGEHPIWITRSMSGVSIPIPNAVVHTMTWHCPLLQLSRAFFLSCDVNRFPWYAQVVNPSSLSAIASGCTSSTKST